MEPNGRPTLPPWTEDVWDRWFYSFVKEITQPEGPGNGQGSVPGEVPILGTEGGR